MFRQMVLEEKVNRYLFILALTTLSVMLSVVVWRLVYVSFQVVGS